MAVPVTRNARANIGRWWPRDEKSGEMLSVYAVYESIKDSRNKVSRHTLTRARDGLLQKGDFGNLLALARLCSIWSGQEIKVDDLLEEPLEE